MPQDVTLDDLLADIDRARQRMSAKNPHRLLFRQCQDALIQLATRVGELSQSQETAHAPTPSDAVGCQAQP